MPFFKNNIYYLPLCCLLLFSCSGNDDKQADKNKDVVLDSAETVQSIITEDSTLLVESPEKDWFNSSLAQPAWKQLSLKDYWVVDSLETTSFTPSPTFYKDYAKVLKWSPDSSFILDIGSYGSIVVDDVHGNKQVEGGEPDTKVSLIDRNKKTATELVFMGASSQVISGGWLNNNECAFVSVFDADAADKSDTSLLIFNVKQNFFRKYDYNASN